jgi:hypothetical protein
MKAQIMGLKRVAAANRKNTKKSKDLNLSQFENNHADG